MKDLKVIPYCKVTKEHEILRDGRCKYCTKLVDKDKYGVRLDAFNDCPGKEFVNEELGVMIEAGMIQVKDAQFSEYWANDRDTLVIRIGSKDMVTALRVGKFAVESLADDFDTRRAGQYHYIRLWWD
jgi:hypothetical protein